MVKTKKWITRLYKYTLFENFKWKAILLLLKFDNIENYIKWLKIRKKNIMIKKVEYYKDKKMIYVSCLFWYDIRYEQVKYIYNNRKIWLLKADKLGITISQ
jgi:hypothetical protein